MSNQEKQLALVGGIALIVFGHKLVEAETKALGLPHAVGAMLVFAALKA